jgi:hypothetical protein
MAPSRGSFSGGFTVEAVSEEGIYALMRPGEEGFMVIDGPDDHITTVASAQEAWQFSSHQGATLAARTLSRWSRIPVEVVRIL